MSGCASANKIAPGKNCKKFYKNEIVQIKISLLQGEIISTSKFRQGERQHVRHQIAQPIRHLQLF